MSPRRSIFTKGQQPGVNVSVPRQQPEPSSGSTSTDAGRQTRSSSRDDGDPDALDLDRRQRKAVRRDGASATNTGFMRDELDGLGDSDDITDSDGYEPGDPGASDVGLICRSTPATPARQRRPPVPEAKAPDDDQARDPGWLARLWPWRR